LTALETVGRPSWRFWQQHVQAADAKWWYAIGLTMGEEWAETKQTMSATATMVMCEF
jgi:hypothetical protein